MLFGCIRCMCDFREHRILPDQQKKADENFSSDKKYIHTHRLMQTYKTNTSDTNYL